MVHTVPESLGLLAGKGSYPLLLAQSARQQGVRRIAVVAFRKETDPAIERYADEVAWVRMGQLGATLGALKATGVRHAVMAGQITPTHLFTIRVDAPMLALLRRLPRKNAETIFGAVADELKGIGVDLLPASMFMEAHMPKAGQLSRRAPTPAEAGDIALGQSVAHATSRLDIGQTVVVKDGVILAVEAFEGTDETILRAGRLGGPGSTIVKVAKKGHDMRFDIPVIGITTTRTMKKAGARVLAVEAGRAILLDREQVLAELDRQHVAFVVLEPPHAATP